jgi:hypothetical protein
VVPDAEQLAYEVHGAQKALRLDEMKHSTEVRRHEQQQGRQEHPVVCHCCFDILILDSSTLLLRPIRRARAARLLKI